MIEILHAILAEKKAAYFVGSTLFIDNPLFGYKIIAYNVPTGRSWSLDDEDKEQTYEPSKAEYDLVARIYVANKTPLHMDWQLWLSVLNDKGEK